MGMLEFLKVLIWMMNYDDTNGNLSGYHQFLHFCHIDTPYVDVLYSITFKAKITQAPLPLDMLEFIKFLILMMNNDEINSNQPGSHQFLHFCHIDIPYGFS